MPSASLHSYALSSGQLSIVAQGVIAEEIEMAKRKASATKSILIAITLSSFLLPVFLILVICIILNST
jgi:hypothetical protein